MDQDFNLSLDTLNLIEEKVENIPELVGTEKDFLIRTLRPGISKWNLMKLESFYMAKKATILKKAVYRMGKPLTNYTSYSLTIQRTLPDKKPLNSKEITQLKMKHETR